MVSPELSAQGVVGVVKVGEIRTMDNPESDGRIAALRDHLRSKVQFRGVAVNRRIRGKSISQAKNAGNGPRRKEGLFLKGSPTSGSQARC